MARKFIPLEEAAEALGIPAEQLNELREAGRAHAYRDGSSWKFKEEEVERIRGELAAGGDESDIGLESQQDPVIDLDTSTTDSGSLELEALELEPVGLEEAEDSDSILLSEAELGGLDQGPSSTIIGKPDELLESDVKLADEISDSDLEIGTDAGESGEITLVGEDSELDLESASESPSDATETPPAAAAGGSLSDLAIQSIDGEGSSDVLGGGSPSAPVSGSNLFEDIEELELDLESQSSEDLAIEPAAETGSDSQIELDADEDDDLVLGEPSSSDITLAGDSGINLVSPSDSGINLAEPIDLSGSSGDIQPMEPLAETPPAEAASGGEALQLEEIEEPAGDAALPSFEEVGEESEISGLDDAMLDESADTLLGSSPLAEDEDAFGADLSAPAAGAALAGTDTLAATAVSPIAVEEGAYSAMNVVSLGLCFFALMLTGFMLFDLVIHIWSWSEPYSLNSELMDGLLQLISF